MAHISKARMRVDPDWHGYIELMARMWAAQGIFTGLPLQPGQLATAITRYQEQVERDIPSDRLLVWNVAEGWEPLCEFLEVDVPTAQFPRLNDSKMFVDRLVDASLAVLQAWRAEDREPARQPA
jgi:hypothetical protein